MVNPVVDDNELLDSGTIIVPFLDPPECMPYLRRWFPLDGLKFITMVRLM